MSYPRTQTELPPDNVCPSCHVAIRWDLKWEPYDGDDDLWATEYLWGRCDCDCCDWWEQIRGDEVPYMATRHVRIPCQCYDPKCHCKNLSEMNLTDHEGDGKYCKACGVGAAAHFESDIIICGQRTKAGTHCPDCGQAITAGHCGCSDEVTLTLVRRRVWKASEFEAPACITFYTEVAVIYGGAVVAATSPEDCCNPRWPPRTPWVPATAINACDGLILENHHD
jgi:hypothetical protein